MCISYDLCSTSFNSCGKFFLSLESPTKFDEIFEVTSVLFFIPFFKSLSCELDHFWFKVLYQVVLY